VVAVVIVVAVVDGGCASIAAGDMAVIEDAGGVGVAGMGSSV
jgi:hypothetical protein